MKRIPLTQGKYALVDDADYEYLNQWKWCYHRSATGGEYAVRQQWLGGGKKNGKFRGIIMHRLIMNNPDSLVDHHDGNGLNNQRRNLRVATRAQNGMNRGKTIKNTSGFKGVYLHKTGWNLSRPWRVRIKADGVVHHIGFFATPGEAAQAYNDAAIKHHGRFARLNKI